MSALLEEIEEIIDYAKGNFFPTSNLLKHALVVAKRIDDKEFEEFITNELKGYKSGVLPAHRRMRGQVVLLPPYGRFQQVSIDHLDAEAARKVSTAYVAERIPIIENTINFQGDEGVFTVGFSPENEGVLPPLSNKQAEYGILLINMQLKELLDDVRTIILDWAIKLHRERTKGQDDTAKVNEPSAKDASSSPIRFVDKNKHWMFEGIGTEAVKGIVGLILVLGFGGGGLWLWNRQSNDSTSNKAENSSENVVPTSTPTPEPTATSETVEAARPPAQYTFEQLRTILRDKSKAEVKKLLGNPFNVSDYGNGRESWAYQNIAYDPLTGKVASVAVISFTNGKVEEVAFG